MPAQGGDSGLAVPTLGRAALTRLAGHPQGDLGQGVAGGNAPCLGAPGEPWAALPLLSQQCLARSLLSALFPFKEPCEAGVVSCQPSPVPAPEPWHSPRSPSPSTPSTVLVTPHLAGNPLGTLPWECLGLQPAGCPPTAAHSASEGAFAPSDPGGLGRDEVWVKRCRNCCSSGAKCGGRGFGEKNLSPQGQC